MRTSKCRTFTTPKTVSSLVFPRWCAPLSARGDHERARESSRHRSRENAQVVKHEDVPQCIRAGERGDRLGGFGNFGQKEHGICEGGYEGEKRRRRHEVSLNVPPSS